MTKKRIADVASRIPESGAEPSSRDPLFIRSIGKACEIMAAFCNGPRDLGLTELAAAAGLDKSSAQRVAHTLAALGWLEKDAATRRFRMAPRVLDLAYNYLRQDPLVAAATPVLVQMRRETGERVSLSLLDDTSLVYAIRLEARADSLRSSLVGRRVPVFCTAGGRAMLARLPEAEARALLDRSDRTALTPRTITHAPKIMTLVRKAARQGYAVAVSEVRLNEITLGAAICGADGRPLAAIHLAGAAEEWEPATFERRYARLVTEAAQALSRETPPL